MADSRNKIGEHLDCDFCLETIEENVEYEICTMCDANGSHERCLNRNRDHRVNGHYHCGQCVNMEAQCPECDDVSEGSDSFVVGEEFRDSFIQHQLEAIENVFRNSSNLRSV